MVMVPVMRTLIMEVRNLVGNDVGDTNQSNRFVSQHVSGSYLYSRSIAFAGWRGRKGEEAGGGRY